MLLNTLDSVTVHDAFAAMQATDQTWSEIILFANLKKIEDRLHIPGTLTESSRKRLGPDHVSALVEMLGYCLQAERERVRENARPGECILHGHHPHPAEPCLAWPPGTEVKVSYLDQVRKRLDDAE